MKKSISPEDFLTRAEKIKKIDFPTSDQTKIIVLPNNEVYLFLFKESINRQSVSGSTVTNQNI